MTNWTTFAMRLKPMQRNGNNMADEDTGYGLKVGYRLNSLLAFEPSSEDFGTVGAKLRSHRDSDYINYSFESDNSAIGLGALVGGNLSDDFALYGRIAYYQWKTEASLSEENSFDGNSKVSSDADRHEIGLGVGAQYDFPVVSLFFEYRTLNDVGDKKETGKSDIETFALGTRFRF